MSDLIRKIDTEYGRLVFTFTKIYTVKGIIYFTSVYGTSAHHFFYMEKRGGTWKIVEAPKPPEWVLRHEEELGKVIEEQV